MPPWSSPALSITDSEKSRRWPVVVTTREHSPHPPQPEQDPSSSPWSSAGGREQEPPDEITPRQDGGLQLIGHLRCLLLGQRFNRTQLPWQPLKERSNERGTARATLPKRPGHCLGKHMRMAVTSRQLHCRLPWVSNAPKTSSTASIRGSVWRQVASRRDTVTLSRQPASPPAGRSQGRRRLQRQQVAASMGTHPRTAS